MFFVLSKILYFLVSPSAWLLLGLLVIWRTSHPARKQRYLKGFTLGVYLFCNSFFINELYQLWEIPAATQLPPKCTVGIILTGGAAQTEADDPHWPHVSAHGDRLVQALWLYRRGYIRKILISGGMVQLTGVFGQPDENIQIQRCLREAGVAAEDILVENKSRNTHENAVFSAALLRKQFPNQRYILCTSAMHMRRALGCFRRQGLDVWAHSCLAVSHPRRWQLSSLVVPSVGAYARFDYLFYELLGYGVYAAQGYL
jgi:uncharacterized SAM-binding protein YcdF (DUF218 family)